MPTSALAIVGGGAAGTATASTSTAIEPDGLLCRQRGLADRLAEFAGELR